MEVNYSKLDWKQQQHHNRYKKHIELHGLTCQECGGQGNYAADALDFGDDSCGPIMFYIYEPCGWCEGTGKVTRHRRGEWLRLKKEEKHDVDIPKN